MIKNKTKSFKNACIFVAYLIIVWGMYRFLFKFPDEIEETIIKPAIWLLPVFFFLKKEKEGVSTIGVTAKNLFPSIYYSLGLGAVFAMEGIIVNFVKYNGNFSFSSNIGNLPIFTSLALSFVTAFSEELAFRGYVFTRFWVFLKNELLANILTSMLWAAIHAPITIFVWRLDLSASIIYLFLTALFGMGSAFVFARTKNIASSIFLHVFWQWPIILFR